MTVTYRNSHCGIVTVTFSAEAERKKLELRKGRALVGSRIHERTDRDRKRDYFLYFCTKNIVVFVRERGCSNAKTEVPLDVGLEPR